MACYTLLYDLITDNIFSKANSSQILLYYCSMHVYKFSWERQKIFIGFTKNNRDQQKERGFSTRLLIFSFRMLVVPSEEHFLLACNY